jgi:GT2 family glycosyltransferase
VVSYNSRERLRACIEPLAALPGIRVTVVDNASADGSLDAVADLPVLRRQLERNGGFAYGCNVGWRAGTGQYVLLLNPDARLDEASLLALVAALEGKPRAAAAGPRIVDSSGALEPSQRRFPTTVSTFAQALFLHRLLPGAPWSDEVVRDPDAYEHSGTAEWLSGACLLVRRPALEEIDGLDEGFFLYCEDTDLCRRLWDSGYEVLYEPAATCVHEGGASAPRASLLPVLAASRIRYARKHAGRAGAALQRAGIALGAATHVVISRGGRRAGHARALRVAVVEPGQGLPGRGVQPGRARTQSRSIGH